MEQESYVIEDVSDIVAYEFFSEGPKGIIRKLVRFQLIERWPDKTYNLSFGDWLESWNDIDDMAVTNNLDGQKVLQTVAAAILDFVNKHPDCWIEAQGNTPARNRFYQMGINKYWEYIAPQFVVFGLKGDEWEPFRREETYDAFLIRLKY